MQLLPNLSALNSPLNASHIRYSIMFRATLLLLSVLASHAAPTAQDSAHVLTSSGAACTDATPATLKAAIDEIKTAANPAFKERVTTLATIDSCGAVKEKGLCGASYRGRTAESVCPASCSTKCGARTADVSLLSAKGGWGGESCWFNAQCFSNNCFIGYCTYF